jgi:MFS family permease
MHQTVRSPVSVSVPPLIKRNTTLFALAQSFNGAGMQLAYGLGPLMVLALSDSPSLAGLSVALLGISRFLVAYPVGKIMDTYGRKPGILLGQALGLVGAVIVGLSMSAHSVMLLVGGMLVFGMGMSAAQQMRVAATDMFPPHMRARALGYVALGSMVGMVISPILVKVAETMAPNAGYDPLGLPWLLLPLLIVPGMVLVRFVRPDPMEIGMHLERYYPQHTPSPVSRNNPRGEFSARALLRHLPIRVAMVCNCAGQGNMAIMMVLTSLVLHHHGHSIAAISMSHAFHSAGMFAFTIPLGKLADRIGRRIVMFGGVATTLAAAGLVAFTAAYWSITLGTFLVGVGWAAANVAATALIADYAETEQRGRSIGLSDSLAAVMTVLMAVVTGPLIQWYGLPGAGVLAMVVALMPLPLLPAILAERRLARTSGN